MAAALGPPEVIAQLENAAKVLMVSSRVPAPRVCCLRRPCCARPWRPQGWRPAAASREPGAGGGGWRGAGLSLRLCACLRAPGRTVPSLGVRRPRRAAEWGAEGKGLLAPQPSRAGSGRGGREVGGLCVPLGSGCWPRAGPARVLLAALVPLVPSGPRVLSPACSHGWATAVGRTWKDRRAGGREGGES